MPLNDLVFAISFDYNYCLPSIAQRIVTLAIQKRHIVLRDGVAYVLFNAQSMGSLLSWKPTSIQVGSIEKTPLIPLPEIPPYNPVRMKRPRPIHITLTSVRFAKPLPRFIGLDGHPYGPFDVGDSAKIPDANAKIFLKRKFAVPLPTEKVKAKKSPKKRRKRKSKPSPKGTLDTFFKKS